MTLEQAQGWARWAILNAALKSGNGHVPSSLSVIDILLVLYRKVLKPEDRFILSKGHAALALYVAMVDDGMLCEEELLSMGSVDSFLGGHPDRVKLKGRVECSTGSLGHGLPQAVGIALGKRLREEAGNVYCLVGDSELLEGTSFECSNLAVRHRLGNLCLIVDDNESAYSSVPVSKKTEFFIHQGWNVYKANGHDLGDIERSLQGFSKDAPLCVIANTIKGYGVKEMELDPQAWHRRPPTQEMVDAAYWAKAS